MSVASIDYLIARRYISLQSPFGRSRLLFRVTAKRLLWRMFVGMAPALKRAMDIVGSSLALLLLGPLFLLIGLLVKMDRGPIFFKQRRVGQNGKEFDMYKFRSMCPNAEEKFKEVLAKNHHKEGITFKLQNDPRITKVGRFLRKFSLDELPQFYNVLRGEMSLVGPRPPVPREVNMYSLSDRRRLAIKPGITCIWQVSGRAEIDFSGQVQLDVRYIETHSFWVDVKILAKTVPAVISGRGAC